MTMRSVTVTAPSRLHFGMFSFGHPGQRQFGGVGVMIDKPGLRIRISQSQRFEIVGPLANRVQVFARQVCERLELGTQAQLQIAVVQVPREHVGLGVGTQLGLCVAAGLNAFVGRAPLAPAALARLSGRGERSAIGTYGFVEGGLLVEAGKLGNELLSPLLARVALPSDWRFVLIIPKTEQGLHGVEERHAFGELPPVPPEVTQQLRQLAAERLVPAADEGRFVDFAIALGEYGQLAGNCFARFQRGAFANERVSCLVERLRQNGVHGAGQTSWGPTVFAVVVDPTSAENLIQLLRSWPEAADSELVVARPAFEGARIETE